MKLVFRTDASLDIGTGHVARCLTLAGALRKNGATCHFVCRELSGNLIARIRELGFSVTALPPAGPEALTTGKTEMLPPHAAWLGGDWRHDAEGTLIALQSLQPDWLVVDHYALDRTWERQVRRLSKYVLVVDDLADRPHDCDLLLDQTLGRTVNDYSGLVPQDCRVLVGSRYALLRPEFATLREYSLQRRESGELRSILVAMGGVDKLNATGRVLDALGQSNLPMDCRVVVLMGTQAPWIEDVSARAARLPWSCEVKVGANNVAELTAASDLAVGAAGSSAWERCALGVPTLLVATADNQRGVARALDQAGAARFLGDVESMDSALPAALADLGSDALSGMSQMARVICDGRGAERVASVLRNWEVRVRSMREDDLENVLQWRNHSEVRRWMYHSHEISPPEHQAWYARAELDPHRHLLIVEEAGVPLGFVQFTETGDKGVADWGFYAVPGAPPGSGAKLGAAALEHAFKQLGLRKIRGEAIASNERSASFHRKLGFADEGSLRKPSNGASSQDVLCFGLAANDWLERH